MEEPEFKYIAWKPLLFYSLPKDEPAGFRFSFPLNEHNVSELNRHHNVELSYLGRSTCLDDHSIDQLGRLIHLVEICLEACPYSEVQLLKIFSTLGNLASIDLEGICLTRDIFSAIAKLNPELQYISLRNCRFAADDASKLFTTVTCLSYLEITNCLFNEKDMIILLGNNPDLIVKESSDGRNLLAEKYREEKKNVLEN